jgi:hypothetical protein
MVGVVMVCFMRESMREFMSRNVLYAASESNA